MLFNEFFLRLSKSISTERKAESNFLLLISCHCSLFMPPKKLGKLWFSDVFNKYGKTAQQLCSKVTIETLEHGVNMFKVNNKDNLMTLLASFWCLYC